MSGTREMVAIMGASGCGKSTLLRQLIAPHTHIVAVDPAGEESVWRGRGFTRVADLVGKNGMSKYLATHWRSGFRVVITPPATRNADALSRISDLLFGYGTRAPLPRLALAIDEMAECYRTAHAQSDAYAGFRRMILQGRHINCSVYGVTQRPQDVATQFRANCPRRFVFALHDATAREAVLRDIGREFAPQLPTQDYEFLEVNRGIARRGRTNR